MPMIECTLIKGYDETTRKLLAERLTDAASATIGADPELVIVTIKEVDGSNYMRGRMNKTPAKAPMPVEDTIRAFLKAMEVRNLKEAKGYLADDFQMIFPGDKSFTELEELVDWAKTRYQSVSKTFENFDTSLHGLEATVTCHGTLSGVWLDGSVFKGVRFIDRFTLTGNKIKTQHVWNDLAETSVRA